MSLGMIPKVKELKLIAMFLYILIFLHSIFVMYLVKKYISEFIPLDVQLLKIDRIINKYSFF